MLRPAFALLLTVSLLPNPVLAQGDSPNYEPSRFLVLMQGFAPGGLGGSGLSAAFDVPVANVGSVNPAALGAMERPAAGISYQVATAIDEAYVAGIGYGPMNGARPQSAAVAVPLGALVLGLSYDQRYAAETDFGCIPREFGPELEPYCAHATSRLETISPQVAYWSTFPNGGEVAVGLRLGFGYGQYESVVDTLAGSLTDWGALVALGASYRVPGAFGLAAYYESALRVEGVVSYGGGSVSEGAPPATHVVPHADALPARLGASAEWAATPALTLGADVARVFWKAAWNGSGRLKDDTDAALWGRLDVSERALVSFGLLSQGRNRWGDEFNELFDYSGRAIYFTLGSALTLGNVQLEAVIADGRLLSAEQHRHTIVKLGASVGL